MSFQIPAGLTGLLQDFTVAVLRNKPPDLVKFAAEYFGQLQQQQAGGSGSGMMQKSCKGPRTAGFAKSPDPSEEGSSRGPSPVPPQTMNRRKSVASERYDPEADTAPYTKVVHIKTEEQRQRLNDSIVNILLFRSLDPDQIQECIDAMFERKVSPGDLVIKEGDDGDNFYVIDNGTYDIFVGGKKQGVYNGTGFFGELALMYNQPRAATIVATSQGTLWAMERSIFRRIVLKSAYNKRKMFESLLENVPLLKSLNAYERMNVADALVTKYYQDGDMVIKQGDAAECMYFVEHGTVRIVARKGEVEKEVAVVQDGGFFGELALVTHKPRAASAIAVGKIKCAVLDVAAFERLMGPAMDIMKRNIPMYEEQMANIFGTTQPLDARQ